MTLKEITFAVAYITLTTLLGAILLVGAIAILGIIGTEVLRFIGPLLPFVLAGVAICFAADMYLRRRA
jgi:hypothetical protein